MNKADFDSAEYARLIGKNLKRIAYVRGKSQAEV
jgi:hypothetical protein